MWSAPEDREQAERRQRAERKRTPAQEKRRAQREAAFNAGYDTACQQIAERFGVTGTTFGSRHVDTRSAAYKAWEYAEDRD